MCLLTFSSTAATQTSSPAKPTPTPAPSADDYFNLSLDDVNKFRAAEIVKTAGNLIDKKEYDAAIKELARAIALYPKSADAYRERGIAYDKKGDTAKALADFTNAIAAAPKENYNYFLRGSLYHYSIKNEDLAIKDLTEAIRLQPDSAPNFFTRGQILTAVKRYDAAIADYTSALKYDPKDDYAYYFRGNAYAATGRNNLATADYRSAIAIVPGNDAFKRALTALDKTSVPTSTPAAKRVEVLFAEVLKSYGDMMDKEYEPKDAEYNVAKKQAIAQKAAIAAGTAKGPLDTSKVCRILGELKTINASMFDYYDLLNGMYYDGDVNDYPRLKLIFQDYEESQELIDADEKNEPALWNCGANSSGTAKLTPLQSLIKSAAAETEVDRLMAEFDKTFAKLTAGLAAKNADLYTTTRAVNCGYYDKSKKQLRAVLDRIKQMDADNQRPYVKGHAEYDKRLKDFNLVKRPGNCTLFV